MVLRWQKRLIFLAELLVVLAVWLIGCRTTNDIDVFVTQRRQYLRNLASVAVFVHLDGWVLHDWDMEIWFGSFVLHFSSNGCGDFNRLVAISQVDGKYLPWPIVQHPED